MTISPELLRYAALDAELVALVKDVKMLSVLSWPVKTQTIFLENWRKNKIKLPDVTYRKFDYSAKRYALEQLIVKCDAEHPIGDYLIRTAQSYLYATRLLESAGTEAMGEYSVQLYGKPGDTISAVKLKTLKRRSILFYPRGKLCTMAAWQSQTIV